MEPRHARTIRCMVDPIVWLMYAVDVSGQEDNRLAAIMYTGIAGFSSMMERDHSNALELARFYHAIVHDMVRRSSGTIIKGVGDAFLVDFGSAVDALRCANDIQDGIYAYNKQTAGQPLLMRIGLHLGMIRFLEDAAVGDGITVASRLQSLARPGCICFSQDVLDQVIGTMDVKAENRGTVPLRSSSEEIHVYEIASANMEFSPEYAASHAQTGGAGQQPGSTDIASDIGRAVEGIARAIEQGVHEWQHSAAQNAGSTGHPRHYERTQEHIARATMRIERTARKVGRVVDRKQAIKDEFKRHAAEVATGRWDAELRNSDHFKPGDEEIESDFSRYRDRLEEKARSSSAGFAGNVLSFVGVNAVLWYINLRLAPWFMWAPIVSAAWGTGVVSSFFAMIRGRSKAAEIDRMPELKPVELDVYRKINRVRDSMAMHIASTISVPPLLFVINTIVSPEFMWAFIPSGIMALSFLGHLIAYPGTLGNLRKKLLRMLGVDSWRELLSMGAHRTAGQAAGPYSPIYDEVAAIRDDIVRDIKSGRATDAFGKDMIPTLDKYVDQVKLLSQSVNEIDAIVATIPTDALRRDRQALQARRETAENLALKNEYTRSIEEIEKQEKACKELETQREMLRLRLGSSANALKQLRLDMARIQTLPEAREHQAMEELRQKASELTGYLDDMKTGYEEASADSFAELERLTAEADARDRHEGKKPGR